MRRRLILAILAITFFAQGCATVQLASDGTVSGQNLTPGQATALMEAQRRSESTARAQAAVATAAEAGQPTTYTDARTGIEATTGYQYGTGAGTMSEADQAWDVGYSGAVEMRLQAVEREAAVNRHTLGKVVVPGRRR